MNIRAISISRRLRLFVFLTGAFQIARVASGAEDATGTQPAADPALVVVQKLLPEADATHAIKLINKIEGRLIVLDGVRVMVTAPAVALLVNVEEKAADSNDVRWSPHLFAVTKKGAELEVLAHQDLSSMRCDFDVTTDKGNKLALFSLPLTKDAVGLVVSLRKAEGTEKAASIEEMMAIYAVQKDGFALAFSQKSESSSAELVDGVKQVHQELTKVELGKKATGKLIDLMLTTKAVEKKGEQVNESKPAVTRWCWNDEAAIYMPECK